ncbi:MAG: hypothetical protein ABIV47_20405 [Roseiflexaceae bacterium]
MEIQPSDEVLKRFGGRVLAALGGRLNQHWVSVQIYPGLTIDRSTSVGN